MGPYYVQFEDETWQQALSNHRASGYESIEKACSATYVYEEEGIKFNVINGRGMVVGRFVTTNKGSVTLDCQST